MLTSLIGLDPRIRGSKDPLRRILRRMSTVKETGRIPQMPCHLPEARTPRIRAKSRRTLRGVSNVPVRFHAFFSRHRISPNTNQGWTSEIASLLLDASRYLFYLSSRFCTHTHYKKWPHPSNATCGSKPDPAPESSSNLCASLQRPTQYRRP